MNLIFFLLENRPLLWHNGKKPNRAPGRRCRRKGDGMLGYIYKLPLRQIIALMLITIPLWAFGQLRQGQSQSSWRALNGALCIVSVLIIASITLFRRSPGAGEVNLIPFSSFVKARTVPEMYREMLMNAMLFFPLGLSLSSALPPRLGIGRRFGLTVLAALVIAVLSASAVRASPSPGLSRTTSRRSPPPRCCWRRARWPGISRCSAFRAPPPASASGGR